MDSKKKKLIIILSVVGVIVLAAVIAIAVIFTREPEAPPAAKEGVVYQTEPETFWVGFGSGYMTFENIPEPAEPEEGALYGQVFKVWALNGGKWEDWLSGTWEMNDAKTSLTLTATWSGDNATALADATSGTPKTYTAKDGKFTIGVNYPGGATGKVTFTLDPVADKVGDGEAIAPPCTEHVDADNDGKCDNCGKTMPAEPPTVTVASTLTATTAGGQSAKIELMSDNTWVLSISYYEGGGYTATASGTYALDAAYNMVLTVTEDAADALAEDSYTLACDYATQTYSGTVECTLPVVGTLTFNFAQEVSEPEEPEATVASTLTAATAGGQSAKIELMSDNTWVLSISYYEGGGYTATASGTYALDAAYNMVLTVTEDVANALAEDSYTLTVDYTTYMYSGTIVCTIPGVGELSFAFTQQPTQA